MVKVLIPLMSDFEEIEAVTVIDILRRAGVEVVTAGLTPNPLRGAHGLLVMADISLDDVIAEAYAGIVLPGGKGTPYLAADRRICALLQTLTEQKKIIAAICAAPQVLAHAGLLKGRHATSHPTVQTALDDCEYREESVVVDDNIITSRGAGTALAFALELAGRFMGPAVAETIAQAIQAPIDWGTCGRPA